MAKRAKSDKVEREDRPCPSHSNVIVGEMEDLWEVAASLPSVQSLVAMNWHRYLPADVGTTFLGAAMAAECKLGGECLWEQLNEFCEGVIRATPPPQENTYGDLVAKRFVDYYGEYERTTRGLIKVLIDLGLVTMRDVKGKDILEIPESLPRPDDRLSLCIADVNEPVVFKARFRENAGPRNRVMMGELPAIKRLLNTGWSRHLPLDLVYAFFAAAAVSAGGCTGDLMWENIDDLWNAQRAHKVQLIPKSKALEVETRFLAEYGHGYEKTSRGSVDVLLELGLLSLTQVDEKDYLDVPEKLPTPDMRLYLSGEERVILSDRLKFRI